MHTQFMTIGLLAILSIMTPGPDFALVTKNTLLNSRAAGIATAFGIACSVLIHVTYCVLGFALMIKHTPSIYLTMKYIGGAYLLYLGFSTLTNSKTFDDPAQITSKKRAAKTLFSAFRQGFICNIFNPGASLFFLSLFTVVVHPTTSHLVKIGYVAEIFILAFAWFTLLTLALSHKKVFAKLLQAEYYIAKILGLALLGFGLMVVVGS